MLIGYILAILVALSLQFWQPNLVLSQLSQAKLMEVVLWARMVRLEGDGNLDEIDL
jgi:hypothetical protein